MNFYNEFPRLRTNSTILLKTRQILGKPPQSVTPKQRNSKPTLLHLQKSLNLNWTEKLLEALFERSPGYFKKF